MTSYGANPQAHSHPGEPRFENGRAMIVAGVKRRFLGPEVEKIAALWHLCLDFWNAAYQVIHA